MAPRAFRAFVTSASPDFGCASNVSAIEQATSIILNLLPSPSHAEHLCVPVPAHCLHGIVFWPLQVRHGVSPLPSQRLQVTAPVLPQTGQGIVS